MLSLLVLLLPSASAGAKILEPIRLSKDKHTFVLADSGRRFVPWGFNYDHDADGRLIEDYWDGEWAKVEKAFADMHRLGANVVRIHLQFGKFMDAADKPNDKQLQRLGDLLQLAERERLYLDLTGLGCYHKKDAPAWYDKLSEQDRWDAQACFWEAVAGRCAKSNAVFCYDLMNEPVAPGNKVEAGGWLPGKPLGDSYFVQLITLDPGDRTRPEIARQWIRRLARAIRKQDDRHLITVGMMPVLGMLPIESDKGDDLDFYCVHIYPQAKKVDDALTTLHGFAALGKPVVIEETFPLSCSEEEFEAFMDKSRKDAVGWIGFFWGQTPEDLKDPKTLADVMTRNWLEFFQKKGKAFQAGDPY
ncbi:MAG TPA: cellulase family glycosylhydrolase [Gemmataceae bacterium]|nr:cellulase family glycosylhydrolase [Gemmataceae bacterium]